MNEGAAAAVRTTASVVGEMRKEELILYDNNEFDVAVVGYGPTGEMAAILLGEMGYRVAAFERWPAIYPLPRAVHYDDEIARVFQLAGVSEEVREITQRVPDFYEWRNRDGEALLRIDWSADGLSGWPVANFFSQPDLQKVLDERAKSLPTVEVNQGWEVQEVSHHADHVELTVRKGHPGQGGAWVPEEETRTVRARYLIGADGANSLVRESMGAPVTDLGFDFDWLILDVIPHEEREWSPMNWQLCDPARPTTIVSGGPGRRRWEFMRLPGESIEELNTEETAWRLLEPWGRTPENTTLERHTVYRFQARWAESWQQGRLLLAGDAAHLMPPFAGQGMCSGLRDAVNLAWKLDLVLSGKASDAILTTYETERLVNVRHFIDFSRELGSLQCVTDPEEAAERDRRMIASREDPSEAPPIPNPPHRLGPGLLREGDPLVGTLSVQGRVRRGDSTGLFDDVVGSGWTVLSTTADPRAVLDEEQLAFLGDIGARLVRVAAEGESGDGAVVDLDGTYAGWLGEAGVEAVVVRPDFYVYGTARTMGELPRIVSSLRADLGRTEEHPSSAGAGPSGKQLPPYDDATPEPRYEDSDAARP